MFQKGIFVINLKDNIQSFKKELDGIINQVNNCFEEETEENQKTQAFYRKYEDQSKNTNSILLIFDNYDELTFEKSAAFLKNIKYLQDQIHNKIDHITFIYISTEKIEDRNINKKLEVTPMQLD